LVDTSVWADHFRRRDVRLVQLLEESQVLAHPFVIGEISLGNLRQRDLVLSGLLDLPQANCATDTEVLRFIGDESLYGQGIGYVDAHLLAATRLTPGTLLWTRDKPLRRMAGRLGLEAAA
jgi:hypothetical protein